jgi:hypothetical protein
VPHSMCGSGARWCARADAIFDVPDMHVLGVEVDDRSRLVLTVESGRLEYGCPSCGVLAVGHGRRVRLQFPSIMCCMATHSRLGEPWRSILASQAVIMAAVADRS